MNFSNHIPQSSYQVIYNQTGELVAIAKDNNVRIFQTRETQLLNQFTFPDNLNSIHWSPDSEYIMGVCLKIGQVIVRSLTDTDWSCKIDEGLAGLSSARWVPDSRQIITVSEFQLRLTIWSLKDKSISYIKGPKHSEKGLSFTSDGKFMALAERKDCKDYLGIYYCGDWKLINHFQVETFDLSDLVWSKDNTSIICWDNMIECKLLVYSVTNGLIAVHEPYKNALGYKSIEFSVCGKYLAGGCYDQQVRLYNHITWNEIIQFDHSKQVIQESEYLQIFKEQGEQEGNPYNTNEKLTTRYRMQGFPYTIKGIKVPTDKPNPPVGVSILAWSSDSSLLATKNDNTPTVVWIWDMTNLELTGLLHHIQPVKSMQWSPKSNHLVIATGSPRIFIWSRGGASICDIPYDTFDYNVMKIKWSPNGQSLLVQDKVSLFMQNHVIIAYPHQAFIESQQYQESSDVEDDQIYDE